MYIQTTGIPTALWFIDSYATNQTRSLFEYLSVPFFGPFWEDFHQIEDGFSILILTNKIASGKSETGDDNTMPQVFGTQAACILIPCFLTNFLTTKSWLSLCEEHVKL